ncbi:MAG: hypothetical protein ABIJ81_02495 [Patescibacteria group bacterium]
MFIVWAIVVSLFAIFFEGLISGVSPINIMLGLLMGISFSSLGERRFGLSVFISWVVIQDLILSPLIPLVSLSFLLSWWLWQKLVESRLTIGGYFTSLASASLWLLFYYISHWLVQWIPFLFNNTSLYPTATGTYTALLSFLIHLVLLALILYLTKVVVNRFSNKPLLYVKR